MPIFGIQIFGYKFSVNEFSAFYPALLKLGVRTKKKTTDKVYKCAYF